MERLRIDTATADDMISFLEEYADAEEEGVDEREQSPIRRAEPQALPEELNDLRFLSKARAEFGKYPSVNPKNLEGTERTGEPGPYQDGKYVGQGRKSRRSRKLRLNIQRRRTQRNGRGRKHRKLRKLATRRR